MNSLTEDSFLSLRTVTDGMRFFGHLYAHSLLIDCKSPNHEIVDHIINNPPYSLQYYNTAKFVGAALYAHVLSDMVYSTQQNQLIAVRKLLRQDRVNALYLDIFRDKRELEIIDTFVKADILFMPYKGKSLEIWLEMPECVRWKGDYDIYIKRDSLPNAIECLSQIGYKPERSIEGFPDEVHDFHLVKEKNILIELHIGVYQDLPKSFEVDLWERSHRTIYFDNPVLRPDPVDLFILLAHHYLTHGWTQSFKWTADLISFVSSLYSEQKPDYLRRFTIDRLLEQVRKHSVSFQIATVFRIIENLSGLPYPEMLLSLPDGFTKHQKKIYDQLCDKKKWSTVTPDDLVFALRSDPKSIVNWKKTIWPSAEYVSNTMNRPVNSPFFFITRIQWMLRRLYRAGKVILGIGKGDYRQSADMLIKK